jgi:hypothetical protein
VNERVLGVSGGKENLVQILGQIGKMIKSKGDLIVAK